MVAGNNRATGDTTDGTTATVKNATHTPRRLSGSQRNLRAMRNGLDSLSWGLMWALDEYEREAQRQYHQKIDEQTARVEEQENYLRELQNQEAESDGT